MLSDRGLCDGLITLPEESYRLWRVVVCDQETSKTRRLKPATGLWKIQLQWVVTPGKQTNIFILVVTFCLTSICNSGFRHPVATRLDYLICLLSQSLCIDMRIRDKQKIVRPQQIYDCIGQTNKLIRCGHDIAQEGRGTNCHLQMYLDAAFKVASSVRDCVVFCRTGLCEQLRMR
jgi:hypothetical protein